MICPTYDVGALAYCIAYSIYGILYTYLATYRVFYASPRNFLSKRRQ